MGKSKSFADNKKGKLSLVLQIIIISSRSGCQFGPAFGLGLLLALLALLAL